MIMNAVFSHHVALIRYVKNAHHVKQVNLTNKQASKQASKGMKFDFFLWNLKKHLLYSVERANVCVIDCIVHEKYSTASKPLTGSAIVCVFSFFFFGMKQMSMMWRIHEQMNERMNIHSLPPNQKKTYRGPALPPLFKCGRASRPLRSRVHSRYRSAVL